MEGTKKNEKIFQFFPELTIPIYINIQEENLSDQLKEALSELNFKEVNDLTPEKLREIKIKSPHGKMLEIEKMSISIGLRSSKNHENEVKRALESVQRVKENFIYRYYGYMALIFSPQYFTWRLGVIDFGSTSIEVFRHVLNRFLGLSLAPFGVVGVYGQVQNKKILVSGLSESNGKVSYIFVNEGKVVSGNELVLIDNFFQFLRRDPFIKDERRMSKEELYAFIMARVNYLHPDGLSQNLRNQILTLSKSSLGIIIPKENDKIIEKVSGIMTSI